MVEKQSGRYTIFDERHYYFKDNYPSKTNTVTSYDMMISAFRNQNLVAGHSIIGGLKTGIRDSDTRLLNDAGIKAYIDSGRFRDAFGPSVIPFPPKRVPTTDIIVKPDIEPDNSGRTGGSGKKGKGGGSSPKKKPATTINPLSTIFRKSIAKDKQKLTTAEKMALKKIGGGAPIKFTPGGKAYTTRAGTYMGKPGQWTSYQGSGGKTITYFNPADNSPPSNFY